jgi:2-hydroxychromene-2-carboxylate isomerase
MTPGRTIPFYLDFISPYSWLALMQSERFAEQQGIRWEMRPVVYAALLDAHGLVGPAESAAKRRYTFHDVVRCAAELGLGISGPPEHPFRSLEALRTLYLFRSGPSAPRLAVELADAAWGQGRSLTDPAVLRDVVVSVGLDAGGLAERIADPAVKNGLREMTEGAIAAGVFGVPTFVHEGELFWGHDRMDTLARRLSGATPAPGGLGKKILARPRGVDRKRAPTTKR